MNTIGVLLLAAATAGDGFGYSKPGVGLKKILRHHVVTTGAPPPGGMMAPSAGGCQLGHPGCAGGASCPGGGPGGPGGPGGMGGPGMGGPGGAGARRFPNVRSQIFFLDPNGMKIGWQNGGGANGERVYLPAQLTVPARYNFMQGYIYRLKLTDITGRPGVSLYPTLEVAPSTPATDAYLTHNPIPVQFTAEDFDQVVDGGNFVTKVIYLPDPKFQELAVAGVETLVSTRLEPGVDPILEADKRGTILLIVRLGAIDLEMQGAATTSVAPGTSTLVPTNSLPPGSVPPSPPAVESVPVDTAPVTPVPTTPGAPTSMPAPETIQPVPPTPAPTTPPAVPAPAADAPAGEVPAPAAEAPREEVPAPAAAPAPAPAAVEVPAPADAPMVDAPK